ELLPERVERIDLAVVDRRLREASRVDGGESHRPRRERTTRQVQDLVELPLHVAPAVLLAIEIDDVDPLDPVGGAEGAAVLPRQQASALEGEAVKEPCWPQHPL